MSFAHYLSWSVLMLLTGSNFWSRRRNFCNECYYNSGYSDTKNSQLPAQTGRVYRTMFRVSLREFKKCNFGHFQKALRSR